MGITLAERRQAFCVWFKGKWTGEKRMVKLLAVNEAEARHDARLYQKKGTERIILVEAAHPPEWEDENA